MDPGDASSKLADSEPGAVELTEVRITGSEQETNVSVLATAPLQDYRFERLDSNRFALHLGEVRDPAKLPDLPVASDLAALSYSIGAAGEGLSLLGIVKKGYEHHLVKTNDKELVLSFYPAPREAEPLGPHSPPSKPQEAPVQWDDPLPRQSVAPVPAAMKTPVHSRPVVTPVKAQTRSTHHDVQHAEPADHTFSNSGESYTHGGLLRKTYTGKPISLDLLDADVRNVLRLISDITGTNMVIEPDVAGKVTLKVEQVPWDHVLDMVLSMNNLGQERVGNVIRIARDAKLRDEWGQRAEAIRARQELMEAAKDVGELSTVYFTINYAQPGDIANKLAENKSERGRVSIDERTSLVIYSDSPARIAGARQLISRLDKPTSQVMIEARIVTMNSRTSSRLGISWDLATDTPPSSNPRFQVNIPRASGEGALPSTFDFNIGRMIANDFIKLDARISALESLGDVRIIAAPNVMTLNNVAAKITQGTQIPYLKLNQEGVTSTEFKDATVELEVTPHITPDRRVRMKIMAKQDEPGLVFNGQTSIDKRQINTELLVEDGEIVVIGGVTRDRLEKSMDGTPGLNKVPILGRFFKTESGSSDKNQLLIFISPKVIDPNTMARR